MTLAEPLDHVPVPCPEGACARCDYSRLRARIEALAWEWYARPNSLAYTADIARRLREALKGDRTEGTP